MHTLFQICAGAVLAAVLTALLSKQGKDIALLLSVAACVLVLLAAVRYLQPVISFLEKLRLTAKVDPSLMAIMLKAVGLGLIAEITALICADAGNAAVAKTVQTLAAVGMLWLSLPLMEQLLDIVIQMTGEL